MREKPKERANVRIGMAWKPSERELIERAAKAANCPMAHVIANGAMREAQRLLREFQNAGDEGA